MNQHGGWREAGVLDYSVNINPLGMPEWVPEIMPELLRGADTYPPILAQEAAASLADYLGEPPERLLLGSGATELLYLFARAMGAGRVLIVEPTFNEYRRAFALAGWEVLQFDREPGEWTLTPAALREELERSRPDVLVLCEPNNPTSTCAGEAALRELTKLCRRRGVLLLLDESFLDFTGTPLPAHAPGVARLRSMTKFYAIAGLRLGYLLAGRRVIARLTRHKEPWSVNALAQGILPGLIRDEEYRRRTIELVRRERERLYDGLRALGLRGPAPKANFLFFVCEKKGFQEMMHQKGFYLRRCEDFAGLTERHFRICVRKETDNTALLRAMREVLTV